MKISLTCLSTPIQIAAHFAMAKERLLSIKTKLARIVGAQTAN